MRVALLLALSLAGAAQARRFALVVGVSEGAREDERLRYAPKDARRVAATLTGVGGFAPEDVTTLVDVDAEELQRALAAVGARTGPADLLVLFYSGHADAQALHVAGTLLELEVLKKAVASAPAQTKVLVIDACRSGALTRVKGGQRTSGFDVTLAAEHTAEGLAILTSSTEGEDSQESDSLQASFFTHFFTSALAGAADLDADGDVTVSEAFAYTAQRTLAATASTRAGPQHPTFENRLKGRDDLVLSRPGQLGRKLGQLELAEPGWYVVTDPKDDSVVVEVSTDRAGSRLTLDAGRYQVLRRDPKVLLVGTAEVPAGGRVRLEASTLGRVEYARVVRKGGTERRASGAVFASGGARGELLGLGIAWTTQLGARLDFPALALELRLALSRSESRNERLAITTDELGAALAVWRAFDLGPITLAIGTEVGGVALWQHFVALLPSQASARVTPALMVAPLLGLQVPLGRVQLRLEGGPYIYVTNVGDQPEARHLAALVTWRSTAGLAVEF